MGSVWMKIEMDEFELPIAVANTAYELAAICGVKVSTVKTGASKMKHQKEKRCYVCVTVEEDGDDSL